MNCFLNFDKLKDFTSIKIFLLLPALLITTFCLLEKLLSAHDLFMFLFIFVFPLFRSDVKFAYTLSFAYRLIST